MNFGGNPQGGSYLNYCLQMELEFGNVGFCGGRKTRETWRKTLGAKTRTNNKLNPHMVLPLGFD